MGKGGDAGGIVKVALSVRRRRAMAGCVVEKGEEPLINSSSGVRG